MNRKEESLQRKLWRRFKSSRGVVYLEFAFIAPLATMVIFFAADLHRILIAEQQLEIGARLMADVESHYEKISSNFTPDLTPCSRSKIIVRDYLAESLGVKPEDVFSRSVPKSVGIIPENVPGPFGWIGTQIKKFENWGSEAKTDDSFIKMVLFSIVKTGINLFTFGTHEYFVDLAKRDVMARYTVSVKLRSILPGQMLAYFGNFTPDGNLMVVQTTPRRDAAHDTGCDFAHRERYYCALPILDTMPIPPKTWLRTAEKKLGESSFVSFFRKLGGTNLDDFKRRKKK